MRWRGRQKSTNVDDRRGGKSVRRVGGGLGIGAIIIIIIGVLMGENPLTLLQQVGSQQSPQYETQTAPQPDDELAEFVSVVLKETEDVWQKLFREQIGRPYEEPVLVLYRDRVQSACGYGSAATGPFYCPGDKKLYIDLSFYDEMKRKFGASGDFALAYVVAHEVAHHVQNLLGITGEVSKQRRRLPKAEYNKLSVRLELQADFLAGVWAHHGQRMKGFLEKGDIEEALNAANAIGDDRMQKRSMGYVVPDAFTHGTSAQRVRWFSKGFQTGDLNQGDTFSATSL